MRSIFFIALLIPVLLYGSLDTSLDMIEINTLIDSGKREIAFEKLKSLQEKVSEDDKIIQEIVNLRIACGGIIGYQYMEKADHEKALYYLLDADECSQLYGALVSDENMIRKYVIINDILQAYFSLGEFEKAKKYRQLLYDAYDKNLLPEFYDDDCFWFDFFKQGKYNVMGYENFLPLPADRFSESFSKIIYYIYSTKKDGSDNKEIFRIHILMFHGNTPKLDYVMTYRKGYKNLMSQTLYQYTYMEDIDYSKLHSDIRQIVKEIINQK
jgi:tetratricopeptide (TPR) repeat protein